MKVVRLHGIRELRSSEEPVPAAAPGESLLRVTAVGICGSDLHWYREANIGDTGLVAPLVIGHEFAAVIADGPRRGERVAVDPADPCDACEICATGAGNLCPTVRFAGHGGNDGAVREYMTWPTRLLHPLPESLSDAEGALGEPLGVALHALDLGRPRIGARVAVIGCGPIGLFTIQLARLAGADTIIAVDPLPHRREAALQFGADHALGDRALGDHALGGQALGGQALGGQALGGQALGDQTLDHHGAPGGRADASSVWQDLAGFGVDVAFEVAGTDEAVRTALEAARPGGRVVLVGIPDEDRTTFQASLARRKGLDIQLARRMHNVYPRVLRLLSQRRVTAATMVTASYPLERAGEAFETAAARTGLKTMITSS